MKILNFGSCNIDYVYSLDHIVAPGETETTSGMSVFPGGKGLNQSIALARAGGTVWHAGCIGEGGDFLRELMEQNGVDTTFLRRVDAKNGHAIIQVSREGDNSIFLYPGSNEMITREQIDEVLEHFRTGDLLLLQNEINELSYLVERAKEKGMMVLLNPSPYNERVGALDLSLVDCLILNEVEAHAITGCDSPEAALSVFSERYPGMKVMLTLGKKGCIWRDGNLRARHPIFQVEAVDTTAAGDTFTGFFAAGLAMGQPIREILRRASCASAIAVSRMGAAPSIPTADEVDRALTVLKPAESDLRAEQIVRELDAYLAEHLKDAQIEVPAARFGYSEAYMGQLITRLTGKSFHALVAERRLRTAAEMLAESDRPVGEIIRAVGYENESFFRRMFRECYGENPLEYRKHIRGENLKK